jgi:Leucine-rich repeat (LRR) protein
MRTLISNNTKLTYNVRLAIGHNYLSQLPSQVALCTNLLYLNLRHNKFSAIPDSVGDVSHHCDKHSITNLMGQILGLKNLQILDLSFNDISIVPENIKQMYSLMFIALEGNRIKRLPVCLGDMSRLTKVKFGDNPIEFPPREVLIANPNANHPNGVQIEEARQICSQLKDFLKHYALREQERRNADAFETK